MSDSYPAVRADDDAWINGEGQVDGRPKLVRVRPELRNFDGRRGFPRKLFVLWEFDSNSSGMPSHELSDEMRVFEDAVVPAFDEHKAAILAYVFTYHGRREWHFYFADIELVSQTLNTALSGLARLSIHIEANDDPEWSGYFALMDSLVDGE